VYETFIVTVGYSNPRLQPAAFPPRYPINQSVHSLDEAQRNQGLGISIIGRIYLSQSGRSGCYPKFGQFDAYINRLIGRMNT
ncbi:hypothetical protein, partial [Legionella sp. 29fVS95]|uniref:hypothetical protein n=1 Tax=Legionella sp. 29fVS95 TaxID=3402813 RepID=UPI003AF830CC